MRVFISYRREDSAGHTGRLYDSLRGRIGDENLFLDLSGIDSGQEFVTVIQDAIHSCDVFLAVIGKEWLTCTANGRRRIDDAADLVRVEIETALDRRIPVIPVLVDGAVPPSAATLPQSLQPLAVRDAHELSDDRWTYDVERLVDAMRKLARVPRPRRRWWLAAAGLVAVIAIAIAASGLWSRQAGTSDAPADDTANFAGDWTADVTYPWGDTHGERFSFTVDGDFVIGTASFLRVPRGIEDGKVDGDVIQFQTRSQEMSGDRTTDIVHRYRGRMTGDTVAFSMQSQGGGATVPVMFTAVRAASDGRTH